MAQPTGSDLFVSVPLTNISVAYMQSQQDFIADKVFPSVPVQARAGQYWKYTRQNWFRTAAQKRAPRTESAGTGWTVELDNYAADVNAVHTDISDQDRADAAAPGSDFDLDADGAEFVVRDILLRRELDWAGTYFVPGAWNLNNMLGDATPNGGSEFLFWSSDNSTPIEDIESQRILMGEKTGHRPNVLVLGSRVYSTFKNHDQFIERIKYSERAILSLDLIAALLDIEKVLVPMVVQETTEEQADETDSGANLEYIYGNHALLAYAAPNAGKRQPSAGYTFEWTGYLGSNVRGLSTSKFRMQEIKSDRIETESSYDMKVVSPDLAVFFNGAIQ